jgi:hypothetical protein
VCGLDLSGSGYEPWQVLVNMVNEPSGSTQATNLLGQLRNY